MSLKILHTTSSTCHSCNFSRPILFSSGIILILILISSVVTGEPQPSPNSSRFVIKNWDIEDGLPVNNVVKLLQSDQGYLWMATFDGLVRFDGINFKVYQSEMYTGLPSNRLVNLNEAADSSLWMETEQRYLVRFKDGAFQHIREEDGLNGNICFSTHRDHNGVLWFASNNGISRYDGSQLTPYEPGMIDGEVDRIFKQRDETLWYRDRTTTGVYRIRDGNLQLMVPSTDPDAFLPFFEDRYGTVWLGDRQEIYRFKKDETAARLKTDQKEITGIGADPYGTIWVSTHNDGFYHLDNDSLRHFEESEHETYTFFHPFHVRDQQFWKFSRHAIWFNQSNVLTIDSGISDYTFDHEGNIWIGTNSEGLSRLKVNPFVIYDAHDGLPGSNIYPVMEDQKGAIWAGTHGNGVGIIRDGIAQNGPEFNHLSNTSYVQSLLQVDNGTIYAGIIGGGLYKNDPGSEVFEKTATSAPFSNSTIYAMYEQQNGDLWLGTSDGVFTKSPAGSVRSKLWPELERHPVRFFLKSQDGALWMASNGAGIARYKSGSLQLFQAEDGFGSNHVRSLYIAPESGGGDYVLWAGTEDRGLIRIEIREQEPQMDDITIYSTSSGMLDYMIHIILDDGQGNFLFNTNRGIQIVPKEQLEAYHHGETSSISGVSYSESDGLRNREGNGGVQQAGIKASDGSIWLPGQGGIVAFHPEEMGMNRQIPPVVIEELIVGNRTIDHFSGNMLELSRQERDFEIRFTSLSLSAPEKNKFRYRLAGFNDTWQEADSRRSAVYTNIPAGQYPFEVMASNNTGIWNPEPASLTVTITPFFYETRFFRVLVLIMIVLLFYGIIRWRLRSLKQNELKLKHLVDERTEQLMLEKRKTQEQADRLKELDKLKTRFFTNISHELRTPLTLIIGPLRRMLRPENQSKPTNNRRELERMLRNSDRLIRLVDQSLLLTRLEHGKLKLNVREIELIGFLKELMDLFISVAAQKRLDLSLHHKKDSQLIFADPDKLDNIIANLISNAIKFTPEGGRITITVASDGPFIDVQVTDTGIGIPAENLDRVFDRFYQVDSSETRMHEGSGVGLSLAREFARLHQGDILVSSEAQKGTQFTLRIKKGKDHFSEDDFLQKEELMGIRQASGVHDDEPGIPPEENGKSDRTKILVVEDNTDLRSFIVSELSDTYEVISASNGDEACAKVSEDLPDLIIADIMMPGMDGISFNRMLKNDSATASIPLIFLTAKASEENRITGFEEGADDYIIKPFDILVLKARVQNLIESRHRLRKLLSGNNVFPGSKSNRIPYEDPFLQKVEEIISENYSNPEFNVTELVGHLYLDRSQVLRKMKQLTDSSPSDYIRQYRLEKAAALLDDGAGSISEVAYAVGYNSLSYFSSAFKLHFETSPSDYLVAARNADRKK